MYGVERYLYTYLCRVLCRIHADPGCFSYALAPFACGLNMQTIVSYRYLVGTVLYCTPCRYATSSLIGGSQSRFSQISQRAWRLLSCTTGREQIAQSGCKPGTSRSTRLILCSRYRGDLQNLYSGCITLRPYIGGGGYMYCSLHKPDKRSYHFHKLSPPTSHSLVNMTPFFLLSTAMTHYLRRSTPQHGTTLSIQGRSSLTLASTYISRTRDSIVGARCDRRFVDKFMQSRRLWGPFTLNYWPQQLSQCGVVMHFISKNAYTIHIQEPSGIGNRFLMADWWECPYTMAWSWQFVKLYTCI